MKTLLLLGLLACGGGGSSDPLVGAWNYTAANEVYTFNADKSVKITGQDTDSSTGCTNSREELGTWSSSGNMLSITTVSGTIGTSGCTDSSLNMPAHNDTGIVTGTSTFTYVISGNTLTITTSANKMIAFTRS